MRTRRMTITHAQAAMVDRLVRSGKYADSNAVFQEALRLLAEERAKHRAKLKHIREHGATNPALPPPWEDDSTLS
jgi:Arc/MetJ-type ribon-helix-helix transcriptional regulator